MISGKYGIVYLVRVKVIRLVLYKTIITDDRQKANLINNYFINIVQNLTKNLDPVHFDTTCYINRITPTIENFSLNWDIGRDTLKSINPNKAVSPDNIFTKDFKLAQDSAMQGLLEVFKRSMDCCKFPQQWRESLVTPVFKKGNSLDPNDYRPISLLSTQGKLLEKVVCNSFADHMISNGILTDSQWGFRRGYSTESLLLHLTESWGVPWIEAIRLVSNSLIFAKRLIVWPTLSVLTNSRLLVWQVICENGSMITSPTVCKGLV